MRWFQNVFSNEIIDVRVNRTHYSPLGKKNNLMAYTCICPDMKRTVQMHFSHSSIYTCHQSPNGFCRYFFFVSIFHLVCTYRCLVWEWVGRWVDAFGLLFIVFSLNYLKYPPTYVSKTTRFVVQCS